MAGEVRSELKITLAGGIGGGAAPAGGSFTPRPVARSLDLDSSQFQSMREFARRARHGRDLAEILTRDRGAVREIEESIMRRQALTDLDLASSRRARLAFTDRFKEHVKQTRAIDPGSSRLIGARGTRPFFTRGVRAAGAGIVAAAVGDVFGANPTFAGAVGNVASSTAVGFFSGGVLGAGISFLQSAIRNLEAITKSHDIAIDKLRATAEKLRSEIAGDLKAMNDRIREDNKKFAGANREDRVLREARIERKAYRRERFAPLSAGN